MFEPKASFICLRAGRLEYGELARPRANWSKPATLSEIKQIKLLEASFRMKAYLLNHTRRVILNPAAFGCIFEQLAAISYRIHVFVCVCSNKIILS